MHFLGNFVQNVPIKLDFIDYAYLLWPKSCTAFAPDRTTLRRSCTTFPRARLFSGLFSMKNAAEYMLDWNIPKCDSVTVWQCDIKRHFCYIRNYIYYNIYNFNNIFYISSFFLKKRLNVTLSHCHTSRQKLRNLLISL